MTAVDVDQAATLKQRDYAVAISSGPLIFRQGRHIETLGKTVVDLSKDHLTSLHVEVELNQTDCTEITSHVQQHSPLTLCAIVVFRELKSNTVEILLRCFPFYCHGNKVGVANTMWLNSHH